MNNTNIIQKTGAAKGQKVGAVRTGSDPWGELAAAIVKQAVADDYDARKRIEKEKKWLIKHGRRPENMKIYTKYYDWLSGQCVNIAYSIKCCHDLEALLLLRKKLERYRDRQAWMSRTVMRCNHIREAEKTIADIKGFFYSQWFIQLCDADGPMIYKQVVANYKMGRRVKGAN